MKKMLWSSVTISQVIGYSVDLVGIDAAESESVSWLACPGSDRNNRCVGLSLLMVSTQFTASCTNEPLFN